MTTESVKKQRLGEVVSAKSPKTIVVQTSTRVPHSKFGKIVKVNRKFHVHDELSVAKLGDFVRIQECRPMSALKRWELVEIVRK
jgi:small subunit ribosomal protein S17